MRYHTQRSTKKHSSAQRGGPCGLSDTRLRVQVDLASFALRPEMHGLTGAQIENLVREAAMIALRADIGSARVRLEHLEAALERVG
jgi:SpoVK/Ycf46/Vps4 family AAA+-type ATPase